VDILSRKDQVNTKEDNEDVQLLKEQLWTRRMTAEIMMLKRKMTVDESDIVKEIKRNNTQEQEVVQALKKKGRLTWEEDGIVHMEGRIYVPNNKKTRKKILKKNHDSVDVGYPEQQRMLELIKQNYWWPESKKDVRKYVQECFKYQQNKVQHQKKVGELHPLEILQGPWQGISIDIIEPLPRSNRMDAIVVIVDQFTKMIRLRAKTTSISSEKIAKIYRDNIWKLHRVPRIILSNQGPQFTSRFMEEFTKALGMKRQLSIAYHSQTDGQTEMINQEIGAFLWHYVNYQQDNWMD